MKHTTIALLVFIVIGCGKKSNNTPQTALQKYLPGIDTVHFKALNSDKKAIVVSDDIFTAIVFSTATNSYIQEKYKIVVIDSITFGVPDGMKACACDDITTDSLIGGGWIGIKLADNGLRRYYDFSFVFFHNVPVRLAAAEYIDSL